MRRREIILGIVASTAFHREAFASTIDYSISGVLPAIRQPNNMACWATAATMLVSWKEGASFDIETILGRAGPDYLAKFRNKMGLAGAEKPAFLDALRLRADPPRSNTIKAWEGLLRSFGPLWITTHEAPSTPFSAHARILTGISGDETADGTFMTFVDPSDGAVHSESVAVFVRKFEEVARADLGMGAELRPQVVHF